MNETIENLALPYKFSISEVRDYALLKKYYHHVSQCSVHTNGIKIFTDHSCISYTNNLKS